MKCPGRPATLTNSLSIVSKLPQTSSFYDFIEFHIFFSTAFFKCFQSFLGLYGIIPHILYGIILWGSTFTSHLKKLQLLQNKAVRAICSLNWREHVTP